MGGCVDVVDYFSLADAFFEHLKELDSAVGRKLVVDVFRLAGSMLGEASTAVGV